MADRQVFVETVPKGSGVLGSLLERGGIATCEDQVGAIVIFEFNSSAHSDHLLGLVQEYGDKRMVVVHAPDAVDDGLRQQLHRMGVHHYYSLGSKGDSLKGLCALIRRWLTIERHVERIRAENLYVGESRVWTAFLRNLTEVACFSQCAVLIQGETGTGKEQAAQLIHQLDQRKSKRDFVLLDCTTLIPELTGSELYGHEKGSFTNASYSREGAFALANYGTLFLDEIGELPLGMQAGLLRAVQEGSYKRIGSNDWRKTYFRLVSATNRDLKKEVQQRHFREDLYYRINTVVLCVPPLRNRKGDVICLAQHFLKKELEVASAPPFDELLTKHLLKKSYDGNVRELKQLMAAVAFRYTGEGMVTTNDLPEHEFFDEVLSDLLLDEDQCRNFLTRAITHGENLHQIKNIIGDISMKVAIDIANNNLKDAAMLLGVDIRTLQLYRQRTKVKSNGHAA